MQDKKKIFVVDDHPLLVRGLTSLIETDSNLTVCGVAAGCQSALDAVGASDPDLIIVDIELKDGNGLDLVKSLKTRRPEIPALILTLHDEAVYAERSLRAGAKGFVNKAELDETVMIAIVRLLNGETYMSSELEARLAAKFIKGKTLATDSPLDVLSDRELQVFRLIGRGRSTRQVAEKLNLSVKTIESHRERIKQKLDLESASELAHRATQWVDTGRARYVRTDDPNA